MPYEILVDANGTYSVIDSVSKRIYYDRLTLERASHFLQSLLIAEIGLPGATIFVAASDAAVSTLEATPASYRCDGTDDQVQIQAAIDALPSDGGKVVLSEGTFNITATLTLTKRITLQATAGTSIRWPTVTGTTPLISVEVDACSLIDLRLSGSGVRGNGVGILLGGLNSAVHSCLVVNPRCFNLDTGIEFGIVGTSSSGDNVIIDPDISACKTGINSKGFVNYVYAGYIRTCNTGIVCTSDRAHQKIACFGTTILSWRVRALDIQRGFGSVFNSVWLEQTSSGLGTGTEVIRVGYDGASTNKVTGLTFSGTTMVSPGDGTNTEDYILALHRSDNLLVEHLQLNTSGAMPDTAVVREESTNTGRNNRIQKVTIGPDAVPETWTFNKISSIAGTGEVVVEQVPAILDADGSTNSQGTMVGDIQPADADYTIGVINTGFSAVYFAKERNGNLKKIAANAGTAPTVAKAGVAAGTWNTQTASGLADVLNSIWANGKHIHFGAGTFDFGYQFYSFIAGSTDMTITGEGIGSTILQNFSVGTQDREPISAVGAHRTTIRDLTVAAGGMAKGAGTGTDSCDAIDMDNSNQCLLERLRVIASRDRGIVFDGKDQKTATSDSIAATSLTDAGNFTDSAHIGHRVVVSEGGHDHTLIITSNSTSVLTGLLGWFPHEPTADALVYIIYGESRDNIIRDCEIDGTLVDVTPAACSVADAGAGSIEAGTYLYKVAFLDTNWRTSRVGTASSGQLIAANRNISLTSIPTGPAGTIARVIYRSNDAGATYATLAYLFDNTTTAFTDDVTASQLSTVGGAIVGGGGIPDGTIAGDGIELLGATGNHVVNCVAHHCGQRGVNIIKGTTTGMKANRNQIVGGKFYHNVQHGIAITSSDFCQVVAALSYNNSQPDQFGVSAGSHGIQLTVANSVVCDDNSVSGCVCYDDQASKTQVRGINIGSSSCTRTIAANNNSRAANHVTAGITDSGTGSLLANNAT